MRRVEDHKTVDLGPLQSAIIAMVDQVRNGRRCVACSRPALFVGTLIPDDPVAWGGQAGRDRAIIYCFCDHCTPEDAEGVVLRQITTIERMN